jgi:hypothetical protein
VGNADIAGAYICHPWGLEPGYLNTTDSGSTAFVIVDNVVKGDNISAAISKITGPDYCFVNW